MNFFSNKMYNNLTWLELTYMLCCDIDQNDTIGKIELNPSSILSSRDPHCKNDIQ